jgi:hypothetical protein
MNTQQLLRVTGEHVQPVLAGAHTVGNHRWWIFTGYVSGAGRSWQFER